MLNILKTWAIATNTPPKTIMNVPKAVAAWWIIISINPTEERKKGIFLVLSFRNGFQIDINTKISVAMITPNSKTGLAKNEWDPTIPEDKTNGNTAQCTAQRSEVDVPRKSILVSVIFNVWFLRLLWTVSYAIMLQIYIFLSLIHIWRCRRYSLCRSRWSPYH